MCIVVYTRDINQERNTKMTNTLKTIKLYTDNPTWTVVCECKKCSGKDWLTIPVEQMAQYVDEAGIDFTAYRQLRNLNHQLIQANN